jgi:hypothetical protein
MHSSDPPDNTRWRVSLTNSRTTRFPEAAVQLDPDRDDGLAADQIVVGSNDKGEVVPAEHGRQRHP